MEQALLCSKLKLLHLLEFVIKGRGYCLQQAFAPILCLIFEFNFDQLFSLEKKYLTLISSLIILFSLDIGERISFGQAVERENEYEDNGIGCFIYFSLKGPDGDFWQGLVKTFIPIKILQRSVAAMDFTLHKLTHVSVQFI